MRTGKCHLCLCLHDISAFRLAGRRQDTRSVCFNQIPVIKYAGLNHKDGERAGLRIGVLLRRIEIPGGGKIDRLHRFLTL